VQKLKRESKEDKKEKNYNPKKTTLDSHHCHAPPYKEAFIETILTTPMKATIESQRKPHMTTYLTFS
jgi:hypothetical protein